MAVQMDQTRENTQVFKSIVTIWYSQMSIVKAFQMEQATGQKARQASLVLVQGTTIIDALDDNVLNGKT